MAKRKRIGHWERNLFVTIHAAQKPMTFAEAIESLLAREGSNITFAMWREDCPVRARSMRRALRRLVDKGFLIELGHGGRREPLRYCLDPEIAEDLSDETQTALHREVGRALDRTLIALGQGSRTG